MSSPKPVGRYLPTLKGLNVDGLTKSFHPEIPGINNSWCQFGLYLSDAFEGRQL
jgi:hypothetical protein